MTSSLRRTLFRAVMVGVIVVGTALASSSPTAATEFCYDNCNEGVGDYLCDTTICPYGGHMVHCFYHNVCIGYPPEYMGASPVCECYPP